MRNRLQEYPDYSAELEALNDGGVTAEGVDTKLLYRIINKHKYNAAYNKQLYKRYKAREDGVPIFGRRPRFDEHEINNRINNDFFSEIVDFKVGYFAGNPIGYSYSTTDEAKDTTGGDTAVETAVKALTDFTTRNNMFDIDMELTKFAAVCGYGGRLFYISESPEAAERCVVVPPYECIVLSSTEVTEPEYAVRYFKTVDIHDKTVWKAEFYDDTYVYYYSGNLGHLSFVRREEHMFKGCPLQIVPNNREMIGDAEKVLSLIDAYDKDVSDCDNDIESFARAYMVLENVNTTDAEVKKAQAAGVIHFYTGGANGKVYYLTKDINDTFTDGHINRLEKNIYRFSKTPNLNDEQFNSASGVSLKFKLTGLETKCGMFQAKMQAAGTYMFRLLAPNFSLRQAIEFDPLQCIMDFKRNFPLDILSEAQAAQAMMNAGLPERVAYSLAFSAIDDIDYVMQLKEEEQNGIEPLFDDNESGEIDDGTELQQ